MYTAIYSVPNLMIDEEYVQKEDCSKDSLHFVIFCVVGFWCTNKFSGRIDSMLLRCPMYSKDPFICGILLSMKTM